MYRLPCQHEGGTGEYYPLTRDEISELLTVASLADNRTRNDIHCRLTQGIKGIKCPHPIEGTVAQKMNELGKLYVETAAENPLELPSMVGRFYQIMQGESVKS